VLSSLMSIGRLMRQRVHGDKVDLGTYALLKALHSQGAMRVTDLAALAGLDTSTVSRHVQQLDKAGLVDRSAHPDDGRAQQVALTTQGRGLLEESIARRHELLSETLEHWDRDDIEALDKLLARFVGDIEHITAELEQH
jgi:DNA-binding MarR family transcriptional regulator